MKYIRTKDERIVDTEKEYQPLEWAKQARDYALTEKEADTIEELIDAYVIEYEGGNHIVYDEFEWAKDKALRSNKKYIIYGAIWTGKGLIYVAKMNDKGDLVLI